MMIGDNACLRLVGQMALVALVIGTSVSIAATERVTISQVLTGAAAWAFVPLIQLCTGLWVVRGAGPGRRVWALERYFDTHRPWSLFLLASHAVLLVWTPARSNRVFLLPFAAVPIALTVFALTRVCREVVGMSAASARRAVALHQAMTYAVLIAYLAWASAYLPRIVGLFP